MSDDEDYYDDDDEDDYFYIDDGPVAEVDDLAEHTMHSPVLRDHNPSDDLAEYWSDWEYYSDDYYDEAPAGSKQDVRSNEVESGQPGEKRKPANSGGRRKRRKMDLAEGRHGGELGDPAGSEDGGTRSDTPIVLWRSKEEPKIEPITHQGNGERVALLKDWRVIFGRHSHDGEIGRNPNLKKRDSGEPIETQAGMGECKVVATRVPRVGRAHAGPPIRRDMPDNTNTSSSKSRLQAT